MAVGVDQVPRCHLEAEYRHRRVHRGDAHIGVGRTDTAAQHRKSRLKVIEVTNYPVGQDTEQTEAVVEASVDLSPEGTDGFITIFILDHHQAVGGTFGDVAVVGHAPLADGLGRLIGRRQPPDSRAPCVSHQWRA